MKKTMVLVMVVIVLMLVFIFSTAHAKSFRSLWISKCMVDVPEEVESFDFFEELEIESAQPLPMGMEDSFIVLVVIRYRHSDFVFRAEDGREMPPYTEIFRLSGGGLAFTSLLFVNSKGEVETYTDGTSPFSIPTGMLKKQVPSKNLRGIFQKMPRGTKIIKGKEI